MKTLRATPGTDGWSLTLHDCTRPEGEVREGLAEALVLGRELLLDWFRTEHDLPEAWRLELAKSAVDTGEIAMGLAARLARTCGSEPTASHEVSGPAECLRLNGFFRSFGASGLKARGGRSASLEWFSHSAALGAALLGWLGLLLRGGAGRLPSSSAPVFALHGEVSTRTSHLLSLPTADAAPAAILVLGRPKLRLARLRALWRSEAGGEPPPLVRPWSRRSLLKSLPAGLALLARAPGAWRAAPWTPPWRERVAQAWRCVLGTASAAWWLDQRSKCRGAVFGHTGTAEAHLLERAMQATGTRTVHAAHGLSGGINFVAHSDVAIWRSGADAAWHRTLGTYGQNMHVLATCPPPARPGEGALLLSNLAHPMNPLYRYCGLEPEQDAVAAALSAVLPGTAVRWRPHPVSARLPANEQAQLDEMARTMGVQRLHDGTDIPQEIRRSDRVLCTPSTVIVEILMAGRVPEIVGDLRWASHIVLRNPDARMLTVAAGALARDDGPGVRLATAWTIVQPAVPLSVQQLSEAIQ